MKYKSAQKGDVVEKKNGMGRELRVIEVLPNNRVKVRSDKGETWEEYMADLRFLRYEPFDDAPNC